MKNKSRIIFLYVLSLVVLYLCYIFGTIMADNNESLVYVFSIKKAPVASFTSLILFFYITIKFILRLINYKKDNRKTS